MIQWGGTEVEYMARKMQAQSAESQIAEAIEIRATLLRNRAATSKVIRNVRMVRISWWVPNNTDPEESRMKLLTRNYCLRKKGQDSRVLAISVTSEIVAGWAHRSDTMNEWGRTPRCRQNSAYIGGMKGFPDHTHFIIERWGESKYYDGDVPECRRISI